MFFFFENYSLITASILRVALIKICHLKQATCFDAANCPRKLFVQRELDYPLNGEVGRNLLPLCLVIAEGKWKHCLQKKGRLYLVEVSRYVKGFFYELSYSSPL